MSDHTDENLKRIDTLWELHRHPDPPAGHEGRCVSFTVDRRYLEASHDSEVHLRVGVSFGPNPFTPEMAGGFLPPPIRSGEFVFGLHVVANKGKLFTIFDSWIDAHDAAGCRDAVSAMERALEILARMPDEEYLKMVRESDESGPLQVSDCADFSQFEVVGGEAL